MKKRYYHVIGSLLIAAIGVNTLVAFHPKKGISTRSDNKQYVADTTNQKANLERILKLLPPNHYNNHGNMNALFREWVKKSNELPPDFDNMPSIPFLPDPFVLDEGGKNIPIKTMSQWSEKRDRMKNQLEFYITGTYPSKPENLHSRILNEVKDGEVTIQTIELAFGPKNQAHLTIELMIPPGKGPFPVFLTQWNHREWAQIAVRRGYIGCLYAGADLKDDTEKYSEIWDQKYDFTKLMRRAFGAQRAVDYLYTVPVVDKEKIGITGHSRNGKQSMIAAAFDERITACISSSGGTGAEVPFRYNSQKYDVEDIANSSWLHPRLRFFIGRENKLPVDQNFFMALIAPRALMLSTAINEGASNPWGIEQAYHESKKVYKFLGAENKLAIASRYGLHSVCARDIENYLDFFDYVFNRGSQKPENKLFFNYTFEAWCKLSNEKINPEDYPVKRIDNIETDGLNNRITTVKGWESKKEVIRERMQWALGEEPPGITNPGPGSLDKNGRGETSFGSFLVRPQATTQMGVMAISPYNGFGDNLFGYLYYPIDERGNLKNNNMPVVIYLHEYDYSKGFNSYHRIESLIHSMVNRGIAVFAFDMLGFGNRIEEGTRFYDRYPHWSKMGKMIIDARGAVEAMTNLDFIDPTKIFVSGYSLGGSIGLYTAALDERIAGVVCLAGFTPMRLNTLDRGTEGIKEYSHLHGLLPRLGFFVGHEARIPYDFHEVLGCIAPRPLLLIAPTMDRDAHLDDIRLCVKQAEKVYSLYGAENNIRLFTPDDYNRLFSNETRVEMYEWLLENL